MDDVIIQEEKTLARVIYTNSVVYHSGKSRVRISRVNPKPDPRFYKNQFKLKLLIGSLIRSENKAGYTIEYNCSKEEAIAILRNADEQLERAKFTI